MTPERLAEIRKRWSNGPNPMDDPPENEISDWLDMRDCLDHIAQLDERVSTLLFTNGVLDSAAKDTQAWSVRAQTAEAKCAQLEAQRGELARELDLTKREAWTAKERHKDEKDRADGLRERLDELNAEEFARAQRGGAVVVAEPTVKQWIKEVLDAAYNDPEPHATMRAATKWFRENSRTIPAERVLADGIVGVDREELGALREIAGRWCPPFGVPHNMETIALFDRLRSAKGEVEG